VLADLGLYAITVREIAKCRDDIERVKDIQGNMMTIRTALGVAIIFLAVGIAMFLPGYSSPLALWAIAITGVFVLFGLINSAILSFLQGFLKTEYSFISTTVGKIVNVATIALIAFALFPASSLSADPSLYNLAFLSIMVSGLLGNIVMTAMIWRHANTIVPVGFRFKWPVSKALLVASVPYGLALFFNTIYFKQDVAILSFMVPAAEADKVVGLYSVSMKIVEVGMMFGTLFLNSMLPLFAEAIKNKDEE
jgi:O-antigen/teichoic acid export membrane protein